VIQVKQNHPISAGALALATMLLLAISSVVLAAPKAKEVEVINGTDTPVPTFDVDSIVTQPVQYECVGTIPAGVAIAGDVIPEITCLEELVPGDKELVIEFVTAQILLPTGQIPGLLIGTSTDNFPSGTAAVDHQISLDALPSFATDTYTASQPVKMYSRSGSQVQIIVTRNQTAGDLIFDVTWTSFSSAIASKNPPVGEFQIPVAYLFPVWRY